MSVGTQTMDKRWYIVHAYSNFEKKVAESIREQAKQRGLEELFEQVLVPTEKVTEVRRVRLANLVDLTGGSELLRAVRLDGLEHAVPDRALLGPGLDQRLVDQ